MRRSRLFAGLLAVVMLLGTVPAAFAASEKPGAVSFREHGNILLDKSAKRFNDDWQTKIDLTVSSITNQAPVAVEFVLDGTSSLFESDDQLTIDAVARQALRTLAGKNAYVGITVFGRDAETVMPMQEVPTSVDTSLSTEIIAKLVTDPDLVGTNVQAGIRAGMADLEAAPAEASKFLVLVTDGGSYWWLNGSQLANNTVNGRPMGNSDAADGDYAALASLEELRAAAPSAAPYAHVTAVEEDIHDAMATIKADEDLYTNFEKGVYFAAEELDEALGENVNLITVSRPYYAGNAELSALTALAGEFIDYAESLSVASADLTESGINSVMSMVTASADTVVRAGSTLVDYLGDSEHDDEADEDYNFDLAADKGFTLNVAGLDVALVGRSGNTWTFADGSTVTWYPTEGEERFVFTLGQDLQRGEKLVLSYYAALAELDKSEGRHTAYPNVIAYLQPNFTDDCLLFPDPELNFRYSEGGGGGGGGGGGTIEPEPVPGGDKPELNTTDHYAYIIGRLDGLVHPEAQITRAEVATIFFRMLTDESRDALWSQSNPYSDITPDMWCNAAVSTMTRAGVIEGFQDGTFRPYAPITRAQFATIAVRFFEVTYAGDDKFSDIADHWAADYINKAAEAAIIAGFQDGTFRPNTNITRAQAMTIFNRVLGRAPEKDHLLPGMITWPDNMDPNAWYYATMQEATNSHEYDVVTAADGTTYEVWTKMLPVRDWAAFEKEWADSNAAANPGEVISAVVIDKK